MTPKKDEYMRGYGDGFKDGRASIMPAAKSAFLALCDMSAESLGPRGVKAIADLGVIIAG